MIKKLNILEYRKLKDISFECDKKINVISGANGTCKSSILHIISNSFQKIGNKNNYIKDKKVLNVIYKINKLINPKLETLTKKDYKDVAHKKGILYKCEYFDSSKLEFRRHNSKNNIENRFSIKPRYRKGGNEKLPSLPIIYLGLFRLFAFGELDDKKEITNIKLNLPDKYLIELQRIYNKFTGIDINCTYMNNMSDIKNRLDFTTETEGIDSNTISAGEDNLLIILTSLISLRYYFECIDDSTNDVESLLLIDEIDATLHPTYQLMLYDLIDEYSKEYKIQVFFTTHSLSLLEYVLNKKGKVFYFMENARRITIMENANIYNIEMLLKNKLRTELSDFRNIPVWMEDDEARKFLKLIFEKSKEKDKKLGEVFSYFHMPETRISADILKNIFIDDKLLKSTMGSICILDGDKNGAKIENNIITLPSNKMFSPELIAFNHILEKYENNDYKFWDNLYKETGYTGEYFRTNIKENVEEITKNKNREKAKKEFNKNISLYEYSLKSWIDENQNKIDKFLEDLKKLFKKVASYQKIDKNLWP